MTKAIRDHIADPTANIALGRCYRKKLPKPRIPLDLILREILDVDGTRWKIWIVHTYTHRSTAQMWIEWVYHYPEIPTFIQFLRTLCITYKEVKIVRR